MNEMPEVRRKKLKALFESQRGLRAMEASNGLAGLIIENTRWEGKEYDALWISSLGDSAFKGKPDNESVDFSSRLQTIHEILEVTSKPIIVDGDTGGKVAHFVRNVQTLERLGVSAVIIEDKCGLKQNSLLGDRAEQILEEQEQFAFKIQQGKKALKTQEFMIIARIESFIAGKGLEDALQRAEAYINAGADGIMIHSYKKDGQEIIEFLDCFKEKYPHIPVVVVPTTYNQFSEQALFQQGAKLVIYANHMLRSACKAMQETAYTILKEDGAKKASEQLCVSMEEILEWIGE